MIASSLLRNSGVEGLLDYLHAVRGVVLFSKAYRRARHLLRAGVGSHDQNDIPEVRMAPVVIC